MITYACALEQAKEYLTDSEIPLQITLRVSFPRGGTFAINQRNFWRLVNCQLSSQGMPHF